MYGAWNFKVYGPTWSGLIRSSETWTRPGQHAHVFEKTMCDFFSNWLQKYSPLIINLHSNAHFILNSSDKLNFKSHLNYTIKYTIRYIFLHLFLLLYMYLFFSRKKILRTWKKSEKFFWKMKKWMLLGPFRALGRKKFPIALKTLTI